MSAGEPWIVVDVAPSGWLATVIGGYHLGI
jgi:hypothetical protein